MNNHVNDGFKKKILSFDLIITIVSGSNVETLATLIWYFQCKYLSGKIFCVLEFEFVLHETKFKYDICKMFDCDL